MKYSWLTMLLSVLEKILLFMGSAPLVIVQVRGLLEVSKLLDTDKRVWGLVAPRWEWIISIIVFVLAVRHTTTNLLDVPFIAQLVFTAIFILPPLYRAIKLIKQFPEHWKAILLLNPCATFVAHFIGLFCAFFLLTFISPTPDNIAFLATLLDKLLSMAPSLISMNFLFGCLLPYIAVEVHQMYDKVNLYNRAQRLKV